jgi:hypothetical protein
MIRSGKDVTISALFSFYVFSVVASAIEAHCRHLVASASSYLRKCGFSVQSLGFKSGGSWGDISSFITVLS